MAMDRFCRGCLVQFDDPVELLQYTEKNRRLFVYSTGLQVKRNDKITFQLCKDCYLNMKVACSFKKQCRSSDKKLKTYSALKDTGETMDLSAYLKNNDDSWNFRFPMLYGSNTPAHQKPKDDDTESSSSIRNFMTDIMPETDLLETEARIIKEVIEEDADLLDESLDSHWLQDDVSIDTNFRLDFSFSPFSTPRSENNAPFSPSKLPEVTPSKSKLPEVTPAKKQNVPDHNYALIIKTLDNKQDHSYALINNALDMPLIDSSPNNELIQLKEESNHIYEESIDPLKLVNDNFIMQENVHNIMKMECDNRLNNIDKVPEQQCTIDKNLEEALKNSNDNEFFLDELLVSPQVIPGMQTPPTPLINNILFGEKLDMGDSNNSHKYVPGHFIETYENVVGDTEITEFTLDVKDQFDLEEIKTDVVVEDKQTERDCQSNVTNFYCKMCSRKFRSLKHMKRHADLHTRVFTCDFCGKQSNDKTNFARHVQTHLRDKTQKHECDICKLEFTSEMSLEKHKVAHSGQAVIKDPKAKKFMCTECTFSCDKASNFEIHTNRHRKIFTFTCPDCGKGFYRRSEMVVHMRYHTGEKPFRCTFCERSYPRRDALTRHIKTHLEKPFECEYCKTRFVNSNHLKHHLKKSKTCMKIRDQISRDQEKLDEEEAAKFVVTEITTDTLKTS